MKKFVCNGTKDKSNMPLDIKTKGVRRRERRREEWRDTDCSLRLMIII